MLYKSLLFYILKFRFSKKKFFLKITTLIRYLCKNTSVINDIDINHPLDNLNVEQNFDVYNLEIQISLIRPINRLIFPHHFIY